jgi:hypothetical protein
MIDRAQPFARWIEVRALSASGTEVSVVADAAERAALAKLWDAPEVESVEARYELKPASRGQVVARGVARARLTRVCVVSLEPFPVVVEEEVDVVFSDEPEAPARASVAPGRGGKAREDADMAALSAVDPPEQIVDGRVDLGALTAEFVSLGLDPYPRKPGAAFELGGEGVSEAPEGPLSALGGLKDGGREG